MRPEFALSLSFEGIGLLYRESGGWRLLDEVPLASDDLTQALGALREMGEAIAADFRCVLVLPNDQIRYLSLETGRARDEVRRVKAAEALEAATPYGVDDLSFDIAANGRMTHVAAVARETLDEAESFAVDHGFRPVGFTAIPPEDSFPQAPDFGATRFAGEHPDALHEHDPVVISITARGPLPAAQPASQEPPAPASEPEAPPEPQAAPATKPTAETAVAPLRLTGADEVDATSSEDGSPADTARQVAIDTRAPAPAAFASIRARRDDTADATKSLSGVTRDDVGATAPVIQPPSGEAADTDDRVSAQLRFDPASLIKGLRADPVIDEPEEEDQAKSNGVATSFFSRRASRAAPAAITPAAANGPVNSRTPHADPDEGAPDDGTDEKRRMTIFGARETEVGGKPRFLGLALTVLLLLFLAGVAAWAALFLEDGVAGLFGRENAPQIAVSDPDEAPVETPVIAPEDVPVVTALTTAVPPDEVAMIDLRNEGDDLALLEDSMAEPEPEPEPAPLLSEADAQARYAVTGIWERGPDQPATPTIGQIDDIYIASIDPADLAHDAIALPEANPEHTDKAMDRQPVPPPSGTTFQFDENGLVVATREGALTPEGITVFLGKPSVLPKALPERADDASPESDAVKLALLAEIRPRLRPGNMADRVERSQTGGYTLDELASVRPKMRPATEKAQAERDTAKTDQAIVASLKPRVRPSNFAQIVDRAMPKEVAVATPVSASVTPSIPSSASVARQATMKNAINLRKVNLIGVYGTANDRRALVRLPNSRYKKVKVGDRIDGGKVVAIGDQELRYQKGGRNLVLTLPKS
ncbi:hypothetical protein [Shimia biformata]|uniref:hypothetical protein n=1 Tax=Shimia biformata TaxID=1294299 RepID=UPI001950F684|nr:hypothetical protein [Shimia biformata]